MKKQTAVEWLLNQLIFKKEYEHLPNNYFLMSDKDIDSIIEQAKAIEREQMIDAYSNGWHDGQDIILQQCKHIDKGGDDAGTQYYNEKYKGGEQ